MNLLNPDIFIYLNMNDMSNISNNPAPDLGGGGGGSEGPNPPQDPGPSGLNEQSNSGQEDEDREGQGSNGPLPNDLNKFEELGYRLEHQRSN
jgi:hypothetical protein